jgi:hypothetical protein
MSSDLFPLTTNLSSGNGKCRTELYVGGAQMVGDDSYIFSGQKFVIYFETIFDASAEVWSYAAFVKRHMWNRVIICIYSAKEQQVKCFFSAGFFCEISGSHGTLMMGAVCTSETSVYFNKTTWRYIPKGYLLHSFCISL